MKQPLPFVLIPFFILRYLGIQYLPFYFAFLFLLPGETFNASDMSTSVFSPGVTFNCALEAELSMPDDTSPEMYMYQFNIFLQNNTQEMGRKF